MSITTTIEVMIEGRALTLDDRDYSGKELRGLAEIAPRDKLVREEPDGTETAIPPGRKIRPRDDDNFFVSVRFRRG